MTHFALEFMTGSYARSDLRKLSSMVSQLNAGGFHLSVPTDHLVYSDYTIVTRRGSVRNKEVDANDIGLPNDERRMSFQPPYSHIFLDEAQGAFDSRKYRTFKDYVSRYFEYHGHIHLDLYLAAQRQTLIDKNIRELSCRVLEVVDLKHVYDYNVLVRSIWTCHEFTHSSEASKYVEGAAAAFNTVQYVHEGDIFRHYDSFGKKLAFFKDRYNTDFDLASSREYRLTVKDTEMFNAAHPFSRI